jgi:hypothetical protein
LSYKEEEVSVKAVSVFGWFHYGVQKLEWVVRNKSMSGAGRAGRGWEVCRSKTVMGVEACGWVFSGYVCAFRLGVFGDSFQLGW